MKTAMRSTQRGLSFSGFIFGAFVLVFSVITGLKLIPAYLQEAGIKKLFVSIAKNPEMQKATPRVIRDAYARRALVEDVTAVKSEDFAISNDGGKLVLSASYAVKIPLAGNISLYLDFNPSSDQ
jgi:hypothetical protein